MSVAIVRAQMAHLEDCKAALVESRLGLEYFPSDEKATAALTEGISNEEMHVAVDDAGRCLGFIWFIAAGAFHSFPYLHIVAVNDECRGMGIGTRLMRFFEEAVFADQPRAFLVVADFNPDARRLYERLGYRQVGEIPGLYKEGVTEYLMMKERPANPQFR